MTTYSQQFDGMTHPKPKGGPRPGAGRRPDGLVDHPKHGQVGTISAIARELGVSPVALHMQRRRREDFPAPVMGHVYSHADVEKFRR